MKKEKKDKKEKIPFRVLWKNPFYNSVIKMGLWIIFFVIIYLSIYLSAGSANGNKDKENGSNKTETIVSYVQMKKDLLERELNVKYKLDDYYITGVIKDNILTGTVEDNKDNIVKFKYDGAKVYQLKKDIQIIKDDLFEGINIDYLLPSKIIGIIDDPKVIGIKSSDGLSYTYNIEEITMTVYMNAKYINKIVILEGSKTYELEYEEINED